jgi:hypothetical protein
MVEFLAPVWRSLSASAGPECVGQLSNCEDTFFVVLFELTRGHIRQQTYVIILYRQPFAARVKFALTTMTIQQ